MHQRVAEALPSGVDSKIMSLGIALLAQVCVRRIRLVKDTDATTMLPDCAFVALNEHGIDIFGIYEVGGVVCQRRVVIDVCADAADTAIVLVLFRFRFRFKRRLGRRLVDEPKGICFRRLPSTL